MNCEMLADPAIDPVLSEGVMTVRDACRFLSIGRTQLYQLMKSGRLPWVSLGSCRRIRDGPSFNCWLMGLYQKADAASYVQRRRRDSSHAWQASYSWG